MARSAVVASALVIASCSACGCGDDDGPDTGPDAGVDAGVDAGRDAGTDAARDASPRDAGPAGWVPLPGLPGACVVERAENASALFDPRWMRCSSGVVGCLRLAGMWAVLDGVGTYSGERGYFGFVQLDAEDPGKMNMVLAATEPPPLGAWRSAADATTAPCRLSTAGLGPTGAMFTVRSRAEPDRYLVSDLLT